MNDAPVDAIPDTLAISIRTALNKSRVKFIYYPEIYLFSVQMSESNANAFVSKFKAPKLIPNNIRFFLSLVAFNDAIPFGAATVAVAGVELRELVFGNMAKQTQKWKTMNPRR